MILTSEFFQCKILVYSKFVYKYIKTDSVLDPVKVVSFPTLGLVLVLCVSIYAASHSLCWKYGSVVTPRDLRLIFECRNGGKQMWINLENYNVLLRTRGAYRRKRQRTLCSLWHFICLKTFLIRLLSLYSGAFCFLKLPSCETVNSTKWLWEKMYILYFGINFA